MPQKIIIDGYNMIYAVQDYKQKLDIDLESARDQLLHDLQIYKSHKNVHILVVFDGSADVFSTHQQSLPGTVEVIFSKAPIKADPTIMNMIQSDKRKGSITVVSDDKEIIQFARSTNCQILSPQHLYERMKSASMNTEINNKYEHDMTDEEYQEWKRIFGVDD